MARQNPFQDIVPPEKRTIRNVPRGRAHSRRPASPHTPPFGPPKRNRPFSQPHPPQKVSLGLWAIAGFSVLVLFFAFSVVFSGAKIIIEPKQHTVSVDAEFEAFKEPSLDALVYEMVSIEKIGTQTVVATSEERVEEKASGNIVIFNNHDGASQRLIKNTRFETSDGLIFRINRSVVVPGRIEKGGKIIPGSIEVTVYADEPGEEYNIGLTDFTIPGFKGSPRFEGFFARSKDPMAGGFVGTKRVIAEETFRNAQDTIHANLETQLLAETFAQLPEGFHLFENAVFVEFEPLPQEEKGNEVVIREKGTLYGVLFEKEAFAGYIAQNTVGEFDNTPVEIADMGTLLFSIKDKEQSRPWEDDMFTFILQGSAHIIWTFDEEQLRNDLLGRAKGALTTVLSGYPSIEQAEVIIRPFWKRTFPEKPNKIKIERNVALTL